MVQSLIGPRIRERRRAQKLTQAALARDVGISPSYLNLIEHNRRGIAGRTLNDIARRLGADPKEFSDGADAGLIEGLTEAAAAAQASVGSAETDRVGELIGRFPGWAALLVQLNNRTKGQAESLSMLSDRLNHDPYLADAMHLILSNITAIQSTSGILATAEGLDEDRRRRFIENIHSESERLTATAKELVTYLDNPEAQPRHIGDGAAPAQAIWAEIGHTAPALEKAAANNQSESAVTAIIKNADLSQRDQSEAQRTLHRHARLAQNLPMADFATTAAGCNYDPLALSRETGGAIADILLRLSHLPEKEDAPVFGMIECDASGGVLMRKEHRAMTLPKTGSACPLWPLYRSFSTPGQCIRAQLETPDGTTLMSYAIAVSDEAPAPYGIPPVMRAVMVFSDHPDTLAGQRNATAALPVGPHCSVCPRKACASRRMPYILG